MNALGVDVSRWQAMVDWKRLRAAGVSFAIIKASQGTTLVDNLLRVHFNGAKAAGLVTGVYHWIDPTLPARQQVDHFLKACAGLNFDFTALDVEQYWQSWQEWARGSIVTRVPPARISQNAREAAEVLRTATKSPVVIYTRASFVRDYAPPMQTWLPAWPLWLAHYPYPKGQISLSWESLLENHLPQIAAPTLPPNCESWRFWQFSGDRLVLPGVSGALDVNFFNGSEADLRAWTGKNENPQPVLTDSEKLERLWRAHPGLEQP